MSSRACPREKIYFVVNEKHLFKKWPELVSEPRPFAPDECPERIISGRDCWIILTWARLCAVDCPFDPVLSCRSVDNAVCVFHWDDATPAQGVHRCFAVVAQADRPRPALSDMTVMQNGLMGETGLRRTMPHWPQPGLIPRDPARGDRLETIAYFGSDQYEPQFVKTGAFQDALRQRGVRFVNRFQGEWHDYQHVDAVLDSIDRLQQESGLYRRMTEHGAKRAQAFDVNMLTQKWISLLEEARERNRRETLHPVMRSIRYLWNRQKINLGKRLSGWRD